MAANPGQPGARADDAPSAGEEVQDPAQATVPFDGPHQAGVDTPPPAHVNCVAFTVRAGVDRKGVRQLLRVWTADARRLTQGQTPLADLEREMVVMPSNLTVTVGFGKRLFDIIGAKDKRPEWLGPLQKYKHDKLEDKWGEGDLLLQICGDDPLSVAHATRHLVRAGANYTSVRWMQQGFLNARGTLEKGVTARNLFGVKDGTVNPHSNEEFDRTVWIDQEPDWLKGGTSLVIRRIFLDVDEWEKLDRASREVVFGRKLESGAPLTGEKEFDAADFGKKDKFGIPVIDPRSHMARATNPKDKPEQKILRRPYNYDLPPEPGSEKTANTGLIFCSYQRNPVTQFAAIQARLDEADRLNQWITHIGSSVWVIPKGVEKDEYWGAGLLEG